MQFIYVLAGWEGSAADGRVLRDALSRRIGLPIQDGYYYLVDAGYTNGKCFLAPFRGQRYHLSEWRTGRQPLTPEEFFNMKHASARNVIERCFGMLKMRWDIIRNPNFYPIKQQGRIIMACCLLQNHIRENMPVDPIEIRYGDNPQHEGPVELDGDPITSVEPTQEWTDLRYNLANQMFNHWMQNRHMSHRGKGANYVWTIEEDEKLVESMVELKRSGNWDGEGGSGLKKNYKKELERILQDKLPGHGLKEKPHIESRCKLLKKQYYAIYDVRSNGELSGFGWDDDKKCVTASTDVWDDYLKSHPDCSFMKNKSFPYYDQLSLIWSKDRATGINAETPIDVVEDLEREENVNQEDEELDEDGVHIIPPTTKSQREGKKPERKRSRSTDGLILSLERMTDALTSHMDKSNEQMGKFVETVAGVDQEKKNNRHKLNEELQKIEDLTSVEKQKAAMKLVRDPELLDYFFTLQDDAQKETLLLELLAGN
ncbi:hypothetical protein C2S51_015482 [Perilla frutescens var. frutescens]|nr:hypothetical protein C2S51_015482 [Perilla frutescens var. frutescens]